MALKDIALEKWGIKESDYLYAIELVVARICTKMSKQKILVDSRAIELDLVSQQLDIDATIKEIHLITDGEVRDPMSRTQIGNYLIKIGVPEIESKRTYDGTVVYNLTKQKLIDMQKYENVSDFLKLTVKYRSLVTRYKPVKDTYDVIAHRGFISPRFDSTQSKHGTIMSFGPNLNSFLYTKYLLPDEGNKLVMVSIEQQILYLMANILDDTELKTDYIENSIKKFANTEKGKQMFEESLTTVYNDTFTTPYGRRLHEPNQWMILLGSMADITKIALVRLTSNIENLTPKAVIGDDLIFQVPIDIDLDKLSDEINKVYQSVVPDGWTPLRLDVSELK